MNKSTADNYSAALDNGYTYVMEKDGMVYGLYRFIYTIGVCYGINETGYDGRFCFDSALNALLFIKEWDGKTKPVVGEDGCTAIK
jgi:hypothetical protein